jgi:hypothetical protein
MSKLLLDRQDKDLHLWNSPPDKTIRRRISNDFFTRKPRSAHARKTLVRMFSPEWLRDKAKRVKYVQRQRKVDPFMCVTKRRRAITIAQSLA